mmetsp:Transcript_20577/g.46677  ORF Transcript_20577/g.46677 Transcript_20577/m.46677 type:complete len:356 (-) Transcript_20577:220-1287(-)
MVSKLKGRKGVGVLTNDERLMTPSKAQNIILGRKGLVSLKLPISDKKKSPRKILEKKTVQNCRKSTFALKQFNKVDKIHLIPPKQSQSIGHIDIELEILKDTAENEELYDEIDIEDNNSLDHKEHVDIEVTRKQDSSIEGFSFDGDMVRDDFSYADFKLVDKPFHKSLENEPKRSLESLSKKKSKTSSMFVDDLCDFVTESVCVAQMGEESTIGKMPMNRFEDLQKERIPDTDIDCVLKIMSVAKVAIERKLFSFSKPHANLRPNGNLDRGIENDSLPISSVAKVLELDYMKSEKLAKLKRQFRNTLIPKEPTISSKKTLQKANTYITRESATLSSLTFDDVISNLSLTRSRKFT